MNPEHELRLECLRLVNCRHDIPSHRITEEAGRLFDFVMGNDRASAVEAAKVAVDALR